MAPDKPSTSSFSSFSDTSPQIAAVSNVTQNAVHALTLGARTVPSEADRKERKLYIGNFPPGSRQEDIVGFFNGALIAATAGTGMIGDDRMDELPVLRCDVFNPENRYCFIEFKTQELTWLCLKLDGILFNGYSLRVGRPHDYVPPRGGDPAFRDLIKCDKSASDVALPRPGSDDHKLFIQGIPPDSTDEDIRSFLEGQGQLRLLNIIKDSVTGVPRGYAFFEYEDTNCTQKALDTLNNAFFRHNLVIVQKADFSVALGIRKAVAPGDVVNLQTSLSYTIDNDPLVGIMAKASKTVGQRTSKVVTLINTVLQEDILTEETYQKVLKGIETEAVKYGPLEEVVIPRPNPDMSYRDGVGKVFLCYSDATSARRARMMLNGRRYLKHRVVCASFYPENLFREGKYVLTA